MTPARLYLLSVLAACCMLLDTARADDSGSSGSAREALLFTGTLLSTRGSTMDQGHMVVEPYFYFTRFGGLYNNNWRLQSATTTRTMVVQTYFIYGVTERIDIEIAPQWLGNYAKSETSEGFGDFPLQIGFQLVRGRNDSWRPDVRVWVQETFPTGSYNDLSPTRTGLGGTGGGSFATTLGIGAQKLFWLEDGHVFRGRLNASYGFYSPVTVQGFNSYGGGFGTQGRVEPGSVTTLTVAGEYTLTRRLILALDVSVQFAEATRYSGTPGVGVTGEPAPVGKGYSEVLTVAPAVEYFWNQHVGLIAGPWFSLRGRNTSEFFGVVAALYLYL
ncbi:MAG TPA: hypothetical protein VFG71_00910 [Nitrospiraceae bacterium]|nr:hypothetical protein [Nitrospiraceae bacterium]